MQSFIVGNTL